VEAINENGRLLAQRITILASEAQPESLHLIGVFQESRAGTWVVSGIDVQPPADSAAPPLGSLLAIEAALRDRRLVASQATVLESPGRPVSVRLDGGIAAIDGDTWTVGFVRVHVGKEAKLSGEATVGARVLIWGQRGSSGALEAIYVRVLDQKAAAPSPTR